MNYNSFLKRDYKSLCQDSPRRRWRFRCTRLHIVVLLACAILLGTLLTFASYEAEAKRNPQLTPATAHGDTRVTVPLALDLPQPPAESEVAGVATPPAADDPVTDDPAQWHEITVRRGDTLAAIFSRLKLSPAELHAIMALGKPTATLKTLLPGQQFRLRTGSEQSLQALIYRIDAMKSLHITRGPDGYQAQVVERSPDVRLTHAAATIDSSLFLAAQKAGLPENLIMELAGIFAWDIDFALDIREGDRFSIIYEENYLDGKKLRDGDIVAAEFTNQGRTYRAVRYTDASGHTDYYTPDGLSLRKAFLRTPVSFTRISSRFGMRYHPLLNRMRAHQGVDYAAAKGTPIKAAGDGKIIFRGRKGGYGNVVIIQHGGHISTLYGHMWKFAGGQRIGSHVRQGQIIGYVGQSGLATGPHLHYEFRINGVHRNPLTVKLPNASPIASAYKADFVAASGKLLAQLDLYDRTQLASNRTP